MTIKKPSKASESEVSEMPAEGGATIADRFQMDATAPQPVASSGVGAKIAVVAGLVALAIAGVLTFVIYQHWQYLANA